MVQVNSTMGNLNYIQKQLNDTRTKMAAGDKPQNGSIQLSFLRRLETSARDMACGNLDKALGDLYDLSLSVKDGIKTGMYTQADLDMVNQQLDVVNNLYLGKNFSFNA